MVVAIAATASSISAAKASSPQLVYICGQQPCTNAQEFEVFDNKGAPIFSVPEYGGPSVFGDNYNVYAPGSIYSPAVTIGYQPPATYDKAHGLPTTCRSPATFIEPHGIWGCYNSVWVKKVSL